MARADTSDEKVCTMRHLKHGRKLGRTASHRKAMLSNLAVSVLDKERVHTTVEKAKEVRSVVERLITYGKRGTLSAIRLAERTVKDKDVLKKLFSDIAPGYAQREGGYVRIIKTGERKGDCASMCLLELVGRRPGDVPREPSGTKAAARMESSGGSAAGQSQAKTPESVAATQPGAETE